MTNSLDTFISLEEKLISDLVGDFLLSDIDSNKSLSSIEINNIFKSAHENIVNNLIYIYVSNRCKEFNASLFSQFFEGNLEIMESFPNDLEIKNIPSLCEQLHISFLNSAYYIKGRKLLRKKSKDNLIENGAVYTQDDITRSIVSRTLNNINTRKPKQLKFLDFATGTGRFYKQLVRCIKEKWGIGPTYSIVNNIYAIDIDQIAINICRLQALAYFEIITSKILESIANHIICKNALIKDVFDDNKSITIDDCSGLFYNGFDAIVSNPPYLVLKPNKRKMDAETNESINKLASYFRTSKEYYYSIEGMLNLYQLSLESMFGMLKTNGEMGIICPSTLFADISASKLRKYMLSKHKVTSIQYFSEDEPLFDNVTQATCIFHLTKNEETSVINIDNNGARYKISINDVKELFSKNWEIPPISEVEWEILKILQSIPKLKEYNFIRNKRGELDLTLFKSYITKEPTQYRLVRGNMLSGDDEPIDINHEYVSETFIKLKSQDYIINDFGHKRLVCQQISNQTQKKRLKFLICNEYDILGNSCNYISVSEEIINQLRVLLNSALLNWRFKITSSNNHINNYELDELPIIPIDKITDDIIQMSSYDRDVFICKLYGLNKLQTNFILSQQYDII